MVVHHLKRTGQTPAPDVTAQPAAPTRARKARLPWRWIFALAALAAAAAGGGWYVLRPLPVSLDQARVGPAVEAVYASGIVDYVRQASIAPVTTAPIRQVLVQENDRVRPGQVLAQLDDGPQQGTALQLEAQAALARSNLDRQRRLYNAGFGARAAFEDAQTQVRAAEAAAASAKARLRDYQLIAPFAGQVLRRDAEPGDLASVGKPLFVVADPASLRITADVDERDVGRLSLGMEAVVRADAFPGRTFPARVNEITPQGNAAGRVFRVRLKLGADTPLRPGMTVETNLITARRENAVLVSTTAIQEKAVWVVLSDKAHRQPVTLGASGGERTEVKAGLTPGAQVIVQPPKGLREGRRVKRQAGR